MDKTLKLYVYVDGVNDAPFPQGAEEPLEIGAFRYDAKRMGGAPTITASVNYPTCLDNEWTEKVYAEFNYEKYYLKQTPTSSYNNESTMYKHDLELVSERVILDNVYFFDAVVGDPQGDDKPVSNSTKVVFFGNIHEFASRLNSSLQYAKLQKEEGGELTGYKVVVDSGVSTEGKLMSFEDQFFSNVLQEIYNTYKAPYYFEGKTIHIGYTNNAIPDVFAYGVDNALLSITKNNANFKIVNRATATGSSENIPFYYPNNSPKGEIGVGGASASKYSIINGEAFGYEAEIGDTIQLVGGTGKITPIKVSLDGGNYEEYTGEPFEVTRKDSATWQLRFLCEFDVTSRGRFNVDGFLNIDGMPYNYLNHIQLINSIGESVGGFYYGADTTPIITAGRYTIILGFSIPYIGRLKYTIEPSISVETDTFWYNITQEKETSLSKLGLVCSGTPSRGDTITQTLVKYVKTSQNLMPYKYRDTDGAKRFYNAINGEDGYQDESGNDIVFHNPYVEGRPKEHIFTVEDIKPTIKETVVGGLRIDMFSEFAYDDGDNDETYEDEEGNVYFKHPYFYGKLRVMDFNLFDHAIENQPMTISFTSGDCGACNFEIGVTEDYPQKNPVQVDEYGNLVRDGNGMVLAGIENQQPEVTTFQERQQDTSKYEVWIALKKEEDTYGILMPQEAHRPKAAGSGNDGDTFVILGINLPQSYIINAEKKLEAEIIKYLKENNDEKFTFSISFSRIFFEENQGILELLNENARINVAYGKDENDLDEFGNPKDKIYTLYVSSFSYTMSEGDVLPEIRVELDEALTISQNALQNAISQVKSEVGRTLSNIDVAALANPFFIRKDADDVVRGTVDFRKGIKFGEGGKIEVLDNNSAKLTIEYLEITKKASFTSLEIQEKTHAGGQILVTPAAINCGEVEELADAYRCYFQTMGTDGNEIFNQFAVGDQAICQTYNAWGSKYYWRLVTGIGEDYIDLSKVEGEYDEGSGIPSAGDKIIQLGNQEDKERQNAIVIAAYGDGSPYIIQYKGINAFELPEDKIVTKLSSTENIFTGKVHMEMGSDGIENVGGLDIGGQNLLRNSGFTGDYLSEPLADSEVMDAAKELFSDPLDHWKDDEEEDGLDTGSKGATVIDLSGISASGYGVSLANTESENARLYQTLYYNLIGGETYTLSFKAKGVVLSEETDEETGETTKVFNSINYTVGDASGVVSLTDEWAKYSVKAVPTSTSKVFIISGNDVVLCDIQLERGTIATAWGMSTLDNSSDRAYWQSMKYVQDAVKGATDIYGGLVLTHHIKVGDRPNDETFIENGGMNGDYTSDESPAFWAGGNFDKAIATVSKFKDNPQYQPTDEELASMANFVVTHGGRAILNDIILRGYIYALGGKIGEHTTIEEDIIRTKAIELSDYVVYKYKSIEEVCNGGVVSETYELPSNAPSFISYDTSKHQGKNPVLILPDSYEVGRTITILSTPIISRSDIGLSLEGGVLYLMAEELSDGLTHTVQNLYLKGGKVELYYAGQSYTGAGKWLVLNKVNI